MLGLTASAPCVDGTLSSGRGFALTSSDSDFSNDVRSPATPGGSAS